MDSDTVTISIDSEASAFTVNTRSIEAIASRSLMCLGIPHHELSVTFTGSLGIRELNREYRQKDSPTDVLSFGQQEFVSPLKVGEFREYLHATHVAKIPQLLGDLVISIENAAINAKAISQGLDREIAFLMVHGILHLCGHDHVEPHDEQIMLEEQRKLMSILEPEGTPPLWLNCVECTLDG